MIIDPRKVKIFASKVFYMVEDAIESGELERHEVAGVLKKLAEYQTELLDLEIVTREELNRCQKT